MPITYTNRKGISYFLCQGLTQTGKPRYYFAREPHGEAVNEIPAGHEISESVNGVVSLVKSRPALIHSAERATVEAVLKCHPHARNYRVGVKQDRIEVYEQVGPDADDMLSIFQKQGFELDPMRVGTFRVERERKSQYSPVMRFILTDAARRTFRAERWCYRSSVDGWMNVAQPDHISRLACDLIPKLGTESFFELF